MQPKQQQESRHDDLFRARLDQIITMKHALDVLVDRIDRNWIDAHLKGFILHVRPVWHVLTLDNRYVTYITYMN